MATVFTNNPLSADVWDMQGAIINFGKAASGNLQAVPNTYSTNKNIIGNNTIIALGLTLQYSRQITKRYPINIRRVIYMMGNPTGVLNINCLFGPADNMENFLSTFAPTGTGDTNAENTAITIKPYGKITHSSDPSVSHGSVVGLGVWTISDPVVSSIGLTISEQGSAQVPAIAQVSMEFHNLDVTGSSGSTVSKAGAGAGAAAAGAAAAAAGA